MTGFYFVQIALNTMAIFLTSSILLIDRKVLERWSTIRKNPRIHTSCTLPCFSFDVGYFQNLVLNNLETFTQTAQRDLETGTRDRLSIARRTAYQHRSCYPLTIPTCTITTRHSPEHHMCRASAGNQKQKVSRPQFVLK